MTDIPDPSTPAPQPTAAPAPPTAPSVFDQAVQQYPIIKRAGVVGIVSPGQADAGGKAMLESWPPGETGDKSYPRPQAIPLNSPGVQIYSSKTRPIDVLGDVVSHFLVKSDPKISGYYQQFVASMTPQQQSHLQEQYQYARQNEGETRSFQDWASASGIPAYFRGYAFQQWPSDFNAQAYTPQQRSMFDQMMQYLQSTGAVPPPQAPTTRLQSMP